MNDRVGGTMISGAFPRLFAAAVGCITGFLIAVALYYPSVPAFGGTPRCPRCGNRDHVYRISYISDDSGDSAATVGGGAVSPRASSVDRPGWQCSRCRYEWGKRSRRSGLIP